MDGELRYPPIRIEVTEAALSPALQKDKEELIEASQILEGLLHESGAVHEDPELERTLAELISPGQMGEKANGFYYRVYVLKDPDVNAMAVPSGSIYVNSGLLATLDNFEQVRAVMAHEAHHVIDQDMVYEFKRTKDETGFLKVVNLLSAPAVAYAISESDSDTAKTIANVYTGASWAVSIAYRLSLYGYSRKHEIECDEFALGIFEKHDYNIQEVKRLFGHFENEQKKYSRELFHTHLFANHETPKQRMKRVEKFANKQKRADQQEIAENGTAKVDRRYHEMTRDLRITNARLNVRLGRVQHALDDLDRLEEMFPADARVMNALGEAYARLAEDRRVLEDELSPSEWRKIRKEKEEPQRTDWIDKARSYFEHARTIDPLFPDPFRGEALLRESQKDNERAMGLYRQYLEQAPEAKDRRYVQAKIERLQKIMAKENEKKKRTKGDS